MSQFQEHWWQQTIELLLICLFSIDLVFEPNGLLFDNVKLKTIWWNTDYFAVIVWFKCKDDGVED